MDRGRRMAGSQQDLRQKDTHAQFLMQTTMNSVLQQLERIERIEGTFREFEIERCEVGDRNHATPEDNYSALRTKLMSLSALHSEFGGRFQKSAENRVCEWIARRPPTHCSEQFTQALVDTWKACQGKYNPEIAPVEMTEEMLQNCSQRLAEAAYHWHEMEDEFYEDPEKAADKPEMYKIRANEEHERSTKKIREALQNLAKGPANSMRNLFSWVVNGISTSLFGQNHSNQKPEVANPVESIEPSPNKLKIDAGAHAKARRQLQE